MAINKAKLAFHADHKHNMKTNPVDLSEYCTVDGCGLVLTDEEMMLIAGAYNLGLLDGSE